MSLLPCGVSISTAMSVVLLALAVASTAGVAVGSRHRRQGGFSLADLLAQENVGERFDGSGPDSDIPAGQPGADYNFYNSDNQGEAYFNPAANGFVYPNAPTPPDAPAAPIDVRVDTADDEVYVDENGIFQVRIAGDRTEAPPPTSTTVRFPGGRLQYTDSYALYDGQPVFTD